MGVTKENANRSHQVHSAPQTAVLQLHSTRHVNIKTRLLECIGCRIRSICILNDTHMKTLANTTSPTELWTFDQESAEQRCNLTFAFEHAGEYSFDADTCAIQEIQSPSNPIFGAGLCLLAVLIYFIVERILMRRGKTNVPHVKNDRLFSLDVLRGLMMVFVVFVDYGGGGFTFFIHNAWNGWNGADQVFPMFLMTMGTSISAVPQNKRFQWSRLALRLFVFVILGATVVNGRSSDGSIRWLGVLQRIGVVYAIFICIHRICCRIRLSANGSIGIEEYESLNSTSSSRTGPIAIRETGFKTWEKLYWNETWMEGLGVVLISFVWGAMVFFFRRTGCPPRYLGPGGLSGPETVSGCTGGIYKSIDELIPFNRLYEKPTCLRVYECNGAFDPENFLGVLPALINVFAGFQLTYLLHLTRGPTTSGNNFQHHITEENTQSESNTSDRTIHRESSEEENTSDGSRVLERDDAENTMLIYCRKDIYLFLHGMFYLSTGYMLSYVEWLPINKNLWTPSFALFTSGAGFLIASVVLLTLDFFAGRLLLLESVGRNSLAAYIVQSLGEHTTLMKPYFGMSFFAQSLTCIVAMVVLLAFGHYLHSKNIRVSV